MNRTDIQEQERIIIEDIKEERFALQQMKNSVQGLYREMAFLNTKIAAKERKIATLADLPAKLRAEAEEQDKLLAWEHEHEHIREVAQETAQAAKEEMNRAVRLPLSRNAFSGVKQ